MELYEKVEYAFINTEKSVLIRRLRPPSDCSAHLNYIPLEGAFTPSSEEKSFDLTNKLKEFFEFREDNPRDPTVMLLLGDAGSGKSVFAQQFYQQCWKTFQIGEPIPVWISLPESDSPFERAVEEVLEKCGLTEAQIETLKATERFLFIVDGYDELHNFQNCYESNHWSRWKAKVLITCRTQALYYQRDYEQYFTPFESGERQSWLLTKLYVAPFNQEQISAYIERYQALNPDQKLSSEDLAKVPNLNELITSPFMLHMAVECLSEIMAKHPEQNLLQVNLYDIYIERWFTREAKKIAVVNNQEEAADSLKHRFWHYCKDLAVEMHSQKLDVIPYSQRSGGRFGNKQPPSMWERFFTAETVLERSACPLRSFGNNHYGFIHATLVNYFATRTMYELPVRENKTEESEKSKEEIEQGKEKKEPQKIPSKHNLYKHAIHRSLFTDVPESIQMLAERIQQDEQFSLELAWCIDESKKDNNFAIAAANAITALVRAGKRLNGVDLSGIRVPGADLSGGYFDCTDFSGANLQGCQLNRAWLRNAKLVGCQLTDVNFGGYPFFKHTEEIIAIDYKLELNRLMSATWRDVYIWEIDSGECIKKVKFPISWATTIVSVRLNSTAGIVAFRSCGNNVELWDLVNKETISLKWDGGDVRAINLSHDGNRVMVACRDHTVRMWNTKTQELIALLNNDDWDFNHALLTAHLSENGFTVASASEDNTVAVRSVKTGESVVLRGHEDWVVSVCLSENGQKVATGSNDNTVRVWDVKSGQAKVLQEHEQRLVAVEISADGRTVVSAGMDKTLRVWDVEGSQSVVFRGHNKHINCVSLSDDGRTVASGSKDKTVRLWNVENKLSMAMNCQNSSVMCVHYSEDGKTIATGSVDKKVRVWDLMNRKLVVLQGHERCIFNVYVSRDGRTVVSGSEDGTVRVWDVSKGTALILRGKEEVVGGVCLSPDEQKIFSAGGKAYGSTSGGPVRIRVWDVKSGDSEVICEHYSWGVVSELQMSKDGQTLVLGSNTSSLKVCDIKSRALRELDGHKKVVQTVHICSDGSKIVSAEKREVYLWDVKSGKSTYIGAHKDVVSSVFLSEDGRTVYSGGYDRTVCIWDAESRDLLEVIHFSSRVNSLSVSVYDQSGVMAVGLEDGSTQVWGCFDGDAIGWQMIDAFNIFNPTLHLIGCEYSAAVGLSPRNERLLIQQGAFTALAKLRQALLNEATVKQSIYIPLQGTYGGNINENTFDLTTKIKDFLGFKDEASGAPTVMLLLGDAGSGKSVFSQQLVQELWSEFQPGDPIPLWISLPELDSPFERAVEEALEKWGLSVSQIETLKSTQRFLFIVDGYDELHNFQNCYETNHWSTWRAKVLITCRTQALYYQRDYEQYFTPFQGSERLSRLLTKLYIVPFNKDQISAYIERYQALNREQKIFPEDLAKVPNLNELISSPFMLHMALECLSDILAKHPQNDLSTVNLYDVYIERWFAREVKKALMNPEPEIVEVFKRRYWQYCKDLAVEMHSRKLVVIPYRHPSGGRFGNEQRSSIWERFFTAETVLERSACPLRYYGENNYGFIHATLVNYFATRTMYEMPIQENKEDLRENANEVELEQSLEIEKGQEKPDIPNENQERYRHPIHQVLFTQDTESVQMLAERIQQNEQFKQELLWCIEASKKDKDFAIAAANAITALVRACVTFNGADLRGVRIPQADISGGYFDRADLSGADLQGCQLNRVWLRNARVVGCHLEKVTFGEYPYINHDQISEIDYRPEINRLLIGNRRCVNTWEIGTGQIIDLVCGDEYPVEQFHLINNVSMSTDGRTVASVNMDNTVLVWNVRSEESTVLRGHDQGVTSVKVSADGRTVVSGSLDKTIRVWNVASGESVKLCHDDLVRSLDLSEDGRTVVSGNSDNTVKVWNVQSGESVVLRGHNDQVDSVSLSADRRTVVSGSLDNTVRVWNVASGESIVLQGHDGPVTSLDISRDIRTVASGSEDRTVRVWDVATGKSVVLHGHDNGVTRVHLSCDGRSVASVGGLAVRIWNLATAESGMLLKRYSEVTSVHLSQDGRTVASGSIDNTVRVWNVQNGEAVVLRGHTLPVKSVRFSDDGSTVVSGSEDNTVRVWNVANAESMLLEGHAQRVTSVDMSQDGRTVASGSMDNTVRVWNVRGEEVVILEGSDRPITSVYLSQDGRTVASGSWDRTVRVWDVQSKKSVVLQGHDNWVTCVHLSNDSRTVASGSNDKTVRVWDVASGKAVVLQGHDNWVTCVHLSNDGRTVLSASLDNTVRVWDVETQTQCGMILFTSVVNEISLHETSGLLAVGLKDSSVQVWKRIDKQGKEWQLHWSSNPSNLSLQLAGCEFTPGSGLSIQNERLLIQRGAIDPEKISPPPSPRIVELVNKLLTQDLIPDTKESEYTLSRNNNNL